MLFPDPGFPQLGCQECFQLDLFLTGQDTPEFVWQVSAVHRATHILLCRRFTTEAEAKMFALVILPTYDQIVLEPTPHLLESNKGEPFP